MTDFPVNTYNKGSQAGAAIAMDAEGDYVVAWDSDGQDGSDYGVYAQRYNASGHAQGGEFRVNTTTSLGQFDAALAMDADGDFVVAWSSYGQDGDDYGVYAQRYDAAGVAQGTEFRVSTYTTSHQQNATVAMDADGDFVVAWESYLQDGSRNGVYAQRYNAAGEAQGSEFQVSTFTNEYQGNATVAMDADGDFVVVWQSYDQDGSSDGIYAQRYDAAGVAQGGEFQVNTATPSSQGKPAMAMDADGDFVVAWHSYGQDGSGFGIYAQRYDASGVARDAEFQVNTTTADFQYNASVAMDANGSFVVTWQSMAQDGDGFGIYAQRYDAAGVAQGGEFQVNTTTESFQYNATMAMDADGDFAVAWQSYGQDGSGDGVFMARFDASGGALAPSLVVDLDTEIPGYGVFLDLTGDPGPIFAFYDVSFESAASTTASGAVIRFAARPDGLAEFLSIAPGLVPDGVVVAWDAAEGTLTLSGEASLADYEALLEAVTYTGAGSPTAGERSIEVQVSSGGQFSNIATSRLSVTAGDLPVNTTTLSDQSDAAVAMDADGDFVVAWESYGQDGFGYGVYAQRYNAAGVAQGTEFRVNTTTENNQTDAALAMDADGHFVVAWQDQGQDGSGFGVYAQLYNAAGVAQGTEFRVNTTTEDEQSDAAVAMDADGDFAVAWQSFGQDGDHLGIYAQRYNAAGEAQGTEFRVNTTTLSVQTHAALAMDADGDFVVAWAAYGQDGPSSGYGIYAQRYNAAGEAQGTEFRVNSTTENDQINAAVAMDADGDFVVAWESYGQDGSRDGVYAQRYNAAGLAQGEEFLVNSATRDRQGSPTVAMDADGDSIVAWESYVRDSLSFGVYAQRYNAAGEAQGTEFRVNTSTDDDRYDATVAMDAGGDFAVAWTSYGQDGSSDGVFMARFNAAGGVQANLDLDVSAPGTGHSAVFSPAAGPVAISDADVGLAGSAQFDLTLITVVLSDAADGNDESLGLTGSPASVDGEDWDAVTGTLTIIIAAGAPPTDIQNAIAAIHYSNASLAPTLGDRTIAVTLWSRDSSTNTAVSTITVADNQAPGAIALSATTVAENAAGAAIGMLSVTDPDLGDTHSFTVSDARFEVVAGTLKLLDSESLNHEAVASVTVDVTTTDAGGLTFTESFTIAVSDVNEAPSVTSGATASFAENGTGIAYQATGSDADTGNTLNWLLGGTDAGRFNINSASGAVTFKVAPNYEAPGDGGRNNVYNITVTASDGTLSSAARGVEITVTDVVEAVTVLGGSGNNKLVGGAGDDTLSGGGGNDLLDGGVGVDRMEGGTGNDRFIVDNLDDVVVELAGEGYDRIIASLSWTLGAELEGLSLTGTADVNGTGNALANQLDGNAGVNTLDGGEGHDGLYGLAANDTLIGGGGNDTLDGGLGADSMEGGTGDDRYIVDNLNDMAVEQAGEGYDRVIASLSHTLDAELEGLSLSGTGDLNGTGNALANRLDGNAGVNILDGGEGSDTIYGLASDDTLIGGGGNDLLDGGLGADRMEGGTGSDRYIVDNLNDVVVELAGEGYDRIITALTSTLGAELEGLTLTGTADLNGTGNALANRLDGNAGANTLDGGEGHDTLVGLSGNDTLIGGGGADLLEGGLGADSMTGGLGTDRFVFRSAAEANGDVISDFSVAQGDMIDLRPIDTDPGLAGDQVFVWIDGAGFGSVAGQLRFASGVLEGDMDGDGDADFQIALSGGASLTATNIWL